MSGVKRLVGGWFGLLVVAKLAQMFGGGVNGRPFCAAHLPIGFC